jgi:LPXTG-motif cell wall-anchored protein
VKSAYAFDVKVVGKDGSSLQPAAGKKVKVSFGTEEAADGSLGAVVYHIVGPKNSIKAQKLATTVNREAKAAEAQTTGLSFYVVEFVSKNSTEANTDANTSAKTETNEGTNTTAKTETTEDTDKTKTNPVTEDKNTKAETVTPAAKDTAKTNAETPAVKKETKTETKTKTSEVKKEKKSETKKTETVKKDKANSKKTEKAKTNSKKSPKTGDTSNMVIWITTSLLAVGGIVVLLLFRRRLR